MNRKQRRDSNFAVRVANALIAKYIVEVVKLVSEEDATGLYEKVQKIYNRYKKEWNIMVISSPKIDRYGFDQFKYTDKEPTDEKTKEAILRIGTRFYNSIPEALRKPIKKKSPILGIVK